MRWLWVEHLRVWKGTNELSGRKCPVCNESGQKVASATVKSLVSCGFVENDYSICLNPKCNVVYFSPNKIYDKKDLTVKAWFKENTSPVPICYCKSVTDQDIIDHIVIRKCCSSLKDIQKHTGANTGKQCLIKNPTGKWCGSTVQSVIAKALNMLQEEQTP